MLINKGKCTNDNGKTKYNPIDRSKRDKIKDEDKVKVLLNDRVKRNSFGKDVKSNVKAPISPNRKTTINNSQQQIHVPKTNKNIVNPSSTNKPTPKINKKPALHTYAVNYCMCGSRKGKKNTLNDEEIMETYIKSSNEILQEANQSSVRQLKPILPLPNPESFQQDNNSTKNKPKNGTNCICLNKVPSNKSVDKLLETLMKWNCDLNTSNYECTQVNCPYDLDSIINVKTSNNTALIQELVNSMSSTLKSRSTTPIVHPVAQESPSRKKNIPSTPLTFLSGSISQPTEGNIHSFTHPMTINNTESEYIGAINLEKSNENNCKCSAGVAKLSADMDVNTDKCSIQTSKSFRGKHHQGINAAFSTTQTIHNEAPEKKGSRYFNTSLSSVSNVLRKSNEILMKGKELYYKPSQIHNRASQVDGSVRLFLDNLQQIVENKSNIVEDNPTTKNTSNFVEDESKKLENSYNVVKNKSNMVKDRSIDCQRDQTNMDQIIKSSLANPCDCDYEIKFMGVTLRDVDENTNKNMLINNERKPQAKFAHIFSEKETNKHKIQENSNIDFSQYFSNVTPKLSLCKLVDKYNSTNYRHEPSCLCNMNINAFKELIMNVNKHDSNQDKALDTKSLAGTILSKQSACVCCFKDKEEAQNLEVNTFNLLKEHLKQKCDEFRENCQSSCIPPEEENKALSHLLVKIKQTISEAADEAVCKCAEDGPTEGTWKRAYSLLQEYLKNKISRVYCKCPYPLEYNESILPDVSAKVCNLIEKDFERLKSLCKCLDKSITDKELFDLKCSFQVPEKDIDSKRKISKQVSNTSIIKTQTASAQFQPILVMESKSCEVMQEDIEPENNVEIIHLSSGSKMHIPNTAKFIVTQCHNSTMDKHSSQELKHIAPIPPINIIEMEITKDEDTCEYNKQTPLSANQVDESQNNYNQLSLPLVGYTVDCTCDNYLGSCVCSKATVQKNNRQIEEIWYDVLSTSNKKDNDKSISYVMDNVKHTRSKSVDKIGVQEIPRDICIHHLTSIDNVQQVNRDVMDNKTSVENLYQDLLQYSSSKIQALVTHDATNTDADVTSNTESDNYVESSINEWFEFVPHTILDTPKPRLSRVPRQQCVTRRKSDTQTDDFSKPYLQNCDCSTVPICHVKMLVKNIEKKLMLSDCTCDSMNSKVCPIHSRKNL